MILIIIILTILVLIPSLKRLNYDFCDYLIDYEFKFYTLQLFLVIVSFFLGLLTLLNCKLVLPKLISNPISNP